jgi:hypothetical protein
MVHKQGNVVWNPFRKTYGIDFHSDGYKKQEDAEKFLKKMLR